MSLAFRLLDHCLTLEDDHPDRGAELERLFAGLERLETPFDPRIEFEIRHVDGLDHILQDNEHRVTVGPERLVSTIMQYLVYQWARSRRWMVVHGAQLILDGKAVLLIGPSGAGKSTLTAILGQQGFHVGSDELVILDEAGRVHPYPVPLRIRESSKALVEDLGLELWPRPVWMKNEWTYFGLPKAYAPPGPHSIGAVVFLEVTTGPEPKMTPVPASDAAFRILTEVLNHEPIEPGWFELAVEISRSQRAVRLERGNTRPTVDMLLDHLGSKGLRP